MLFMRYSQIIMINFIVSCFVLLQFLKDLTLRRRAYGTTLCQILVPVVLLGLAGLLQLIANVILADFKPTVPGTDRPSFPQG